VVNVYAAKTWALRKSISLGDGSDTDNLRFDEASKRVFAGIVGGIAMIDAATEAHVGDLKGSGGSCAPLVCGKTDFASSPIRLTALVWVAAIAALTATVLEHRC
jgi:hypothetical protein